MYKRRIKVKKIMIPLNITKRETDERGDRQSFKIENVMNLHTHQKM